MSYDRPSWFDKIVDRCNKSTLFTCVTVLFFIFGGLAAVIIFLGLLGHWLRFWLDLVCLTSFGT